MAKTKAEKFEHNPSLLRPEIGSDVFHFKERPYFQEGSGSCPELRKKRKWKVGLILKFSFIW